MSRSAFEIDAQRHGLKLPVRRGKNVSGRGRVCFYNEHLFPVLVPTGIPFAGGAETQLAKLVHGLHARGFDITVVSCDFGQPHDMTVRGVRMLRTFAPDDGAPVLRFFHPRLSHTLSALHEADAEVYYVNGSGMQAGLAFDVARWRGAGYVNHVASDYDVLRALPTHGNPRDRWWYRRAIHGADLRLAQTEFQRERLRSEFGVASTLLPNVVEIPGETIDAGQDGVVVWLGTYKAIKRPDWFTRLAREFPERRFVMAGVIPPPPLTQQHWEDAQRAANDTPNLVVRSFLDHAHLRELFRGAALLVHTSPVEGFSNVLLEAWSYGLPTVSCVDPDGLVRGKRLGGAADTFEQLVAETRRLLADPSERRASGARARAYAVAHHAPDVVFDRLAGVLDPLVAEVRTRRDRR
ncbi:MAG TPA: glycosyltransferase family 4 protein [Candidatus Saccharimonadaceae bacterium]|nr:glycosyltransferase family 4 protein [Candidatus Saccharimonadaceae bacterium]